MADGSSVPNVLVFLTDQQRWDSCSCYGNPMGLTPHLDAMARRGTLFEHAFTCQPVCGPARASLQTGLYARAAGVWRIVSVDTGWPARFYTGKELLRLKRIYDKANLKLSV
jgi:arylsulfatase A-like enzyme